MKHPPFHSRMFRYALVAVFALASSGFTSVLHQCMAEEQMACCVSPGMAGSDDCESPTQSGVKFESYMSCHVVTIVGGVFVPPALMEKQDKPNQRSLAGAGVTIAFENQLSATRQSVSLFFFPENKTVSPPHRYILLSSFLI